jgi:hypothetical protein
LSFRKKPPTVNSKTNREFWQKEFKNTLFSFTDTCQIATMGLLALHYLDYENELQAQPKYYQELYSKWEKEKDLSPYFLEFKQKLQLHGVLKENTFYNLWASLLVILISGGILLIFLNKKKSQRKTFSDTKIAQLSNQELRVFELLKTGKTIK